MSRTVAVLPPPGDASRVSFFLADHPQWSAWWDKKHGLWRVAEDDPDSDLYAESSDADIVMGYITMSARDTRWRPYHSCLSGMALRAWQGYKSIGTSLKASCISAAVEKRSGLSGAHAFMRNCASSALSSGRIVLGSITGS